MKYSEYAECGCVMGTDGVIHEPLCKSQIGSDAEVIE